MELVDVIVFDIFKIVFFYCWLYNREIFDKCIVNFLNMIIIYIF